MVNLADKLKYYDPVLEKTVDSFIDDDNTHAAANSQWQNNLQQLMNQLPVNFT